MLKDQLAAQKGPLKLLEGQAIPTQCKAALKTIADAMDFILERQLYAKCFHEDGF